MHIKNTALVCLTMMCWIALPAATQKNDFTLRKPLSLADEYAATHVLFQHYDKPASQTLCDQDGLEKLEVLKGSRDGNPGLIDLFEVQTIFGKKIATETLTTGHPVEHVKQRQAAIKFLNDNPAVGCAIEQALHHIAQGQDLFLSFTDAKYQLDHKIMQNVFFGRWLSMLNKEVLPLAALRIYRNLYNAIVWFTPLQLAFNGYTNYIATTHQEDWYAKNWLGKITAYAQVPYHAVVSTGQLELKNHNPYPALNETDIAILGDYNKHQLDALLAGTHKKYATQAHEIAHWQQEEEFHRKEKKRLEPDYKKIKQTDMTVGDKLNYQLYTSPNHSFKAFLLSYGIVALGDLIYGWRVKQGIENVKLDHAILTNLHTKLIGAAAVIEGLTELNELVHTYPILLDVMPDLIGIRDLFDRALHTRDFNNLVQLLQTNTFKGDASFFSNSARILAAYTLINEHLTAFAPALAAAGTCDFMLSASRLMQKNESHVAHYCFVDFVDSDAAYIKLADFWNPFMQPQKAVLNSVELGGNHETHNLLVSGPNGTGKSVVTKAIALNMVLAHTLGITAADSAHIAFLNSLKVYLNVQESLAHDLSTFMAESKKLRELEESILTLPADKRCFVLVDEALKGTLNAEGGQRLFEFGQHIAQQPNSICLLATHHEKPTELELATGGHFQNCHLDVQEPELGTFIRTFKLKLGLNNWWLTDADKRARFFAWLTTLPIMHT